MDNSKIRLVYILAASHSGSTLLSLLLGAHPDVYTVGELKISNLDDKERYLCSCGIKIKQCPFWNEVSARMAQKGLSFDVTNAGSNFTGIQSAYCQKLLAPLHRGRILEAVRDVALWLSPEWRKHLRKVQHRNFLLMKTILDITGKKVIVDSSKVGLRLKYLLRNPQIDVKVIRLVRDGRAVMLTYVDPANYADAKNPALRQGGRGGNREREKLPLEKAAREWLRSNEEAEEVLKTLPRHRWIQLRYEDYCCNTRQELERLFEFIGVNPAKWPWPKMNRLEYHVIGNGMRLDWDGSVVLDERWKQALTPKNLSTFGKISGSMNRKLGYL